MTDAQWHMNDMKKGGPKAAQPGPRAISHYFATVKAAVKAAAVKAAAEAASRASGSGEQDHPERDGAAMASNAACLMAVRTMSGIWGQAALVGSHRKSSGFVCGHEAGAFRCEWPPSIGRLMTTKPDAFSCATSLSATTLDMVSADCVRASALPLVKASASAVSTSRGSAGVSFSSSGMETG
jgi:hypothetical protein